jgi:DNA/RNA-binding domain of Phe-tRNA-synthetase-like protein
MPLSALSCITLVPPLPEALAPLGFVVSGRAPRAEAPPGAQLPGAAAVDETVKTAVRALLRWGGFKPSGRSRPASEGLAKALADGRWPAIHPLVDECNRLSLGSGLPISVLDAALLSGSLRIRLGARDEEYVFNPSGQVLDIEGLLVLADDDGPTGSPVKDAQRTKVCDSTDRFLILIWGTSACPRAGQSVEQGLCRWCAANGLECRPLLFSG